VARRNWHKWIRKSHRYLGILIGIQFLMWTIGGLYFSWTSLDEVHGSDLIGPPPTLAPETALAPLDQVTAQVDGTIRRIDLLPLPGEKAVYRVSHRDAEGETASGLFDALTAEPRDALSEAECRALAEQRHAGGAGILSTRYLESSGPHGEYRELPLPAYAFTFDDERRTTIYVAPGEARITSVRNSKWRVFDFLWMLHTMDYEGRDNFNNRLLQAFSVFGLLTIASGFGLFFISSPLLRKKKLSQTTR
jgi:uncharacterized iron-regulated membrane protein